MLNVVAMGLGKVKNLFLFVCLFVCLYPQGTFVILCCLLLGSLYFQFQNVSAQSAKNKVVANVYTCTVVMTAS